MESTEYFRLQFLTDQNKTLGIRVNDAKTGLDLNTLNEKLGLILASNALGGTSGTADRFRKCEFVRETVEVLV